MCIILKYFLYILNEILLLFFSFYLNVILSFGYFAVFLSSLLVLSCCSLK